ncbi:MAG: hypothetical protein ACXAC5_03740 [Promethearchaeota archaeon]|jgi:septal ring factor EnvC (AmiA/AmiB activator)
MPHASNCITKACRGCGPDSEIGKLNEKLTQEQQRNVTLLKEIGKVREKLVEANEHIKRLQHERTLLS